MTIIVVNHFNSMTEMQLNRTGLRIKSMIRHLIIISLSVKETQETPCITHEEVSTKSSFLGLLTHIYSAGILLDFTTEILICNSKCLQPLYQSIEEGEMCYSALIINVTVNSVHNIHKLWNKHMVWRGKGKGKQLWWILTLGWTRIA